MASDFLAALIQPKQAAIGAATPSVANVLRLLQMFPSNDPAYPETKPATTPKENLKLREIAAQYGWDSGKQFRALQELMSRESGGDRFAQNPTSTAYGRWQFLDDTWDDVGGHKTSNRKLQDIYGTRYIKQRYGSPLEALLFHDKEGYY